MSFPKVTIKYEIPPPSPPPTTTSGSGAGGGTGEAGGGATVIPLVSAAADGLAPRIPAGSGGAPHSFLRDDTHWGRVAYADLYAVPLRFPPLPHAASHLTGSDPLPLPTASAPGLVPPLPTDATKVLGGGGNWISVPTPSGGGLPPALNDTSQYLRSDGLYAPLTQLSAGKAGIVSSAPGDATQVLLGNAQWGPVPGGGGGGSSSLLSWTSLTGVPLTFTPSAHAVSHITGADLLPLATVPAPGLLSALPNASATRKWLRGDGSFSLFATTDLSGGFNFATPLFVSPATVALGSGTASSGAVQISNPPGDSGSPSLTLAKLSSDHSTTVRLAQIGLDVNGIEVSTDLAGPVTIIGSNAQLTPATTARSGAVPALVAAGSGAGQQTAVWLRGDDSWQPLIGTIAGPAGDTAAVGNVMNWGGGTLPLGWLACDGSSVSRTTYAALFAQIGTTYGSIDGNSFNLPGPSVATHASTHLSGGSDPISLASSSIAGLCPPIDNVSIVISGGKLTSSGSSPTTSQRYNAIRNPEMIIAQRGTSIAAVSNDYTLDGLKVQKVGSMVATVSQIAAAIPADNSGNNWYPYIPYAQRATFTTAQAGTLGTSQYAYFFQKVEGFLASALKSNPTSISFLIRSSSTGTFTVSLEDSSYSYSYVQMVIIASANVWQRITLPNIPVFAVSGTFPDDTGTSYTLGICLGAGASLLTSTLGAWTAGNFIAGTGQTNFANTVSTTFDFTAVQHEPNAACTPYIKREVEAEIALNFRYLLMYNAPIGISMTATYCYCYGLVPFPAVMRAAPTLVAGGSFNIAGSATPTLVASTPYVGYVYNPGGSWAAGNGVNYNGGFTAEL